MKKRFLILDANVLIDLLECDPTLIRLICTHVGQIYLAESVLNEVKEISEGECIDLGIILVEPDLEQAFLATERRGPISFQDHLCLILAKEHEWTCVTNDKPLRKECDEEGVPLIWGIELICLLVESGGLPHMDAVDIILAIQQNNPKYITEKIVKRAFKRLGINNN